MFNLSPEEEINLDILRIQLESYAKIMQISEKVYLTMDPFEKQNACAASNSRGNAVAIGRVWLKGYMNDTSKKIELIKLIDNFSDDPECLVSKFQNLTSHEKNHLQNLMSDTEFEISDEEIESVLFHELGHIKLKHFSKMQWVQWGNKTLTVLGSGGLLYLISEIGIDTLYSRLILTAGAVSLRALTILIPSFWSKKFEKEADQQGRISERIFKGEFRLHKRSIIKDLLNGKNINTSNPSHPNDLDRLKDANHYKRNLFPSK
ncbi:MAG: M48 family metalloprotease [Parachlamydiaceae bacterium]|nr:M48 family metalloprotease [Parachlamydiaceae bacterium]